MTTQEFEFRPANDNEMAQFEKLSQYVFAMPPAEGERPSPIQPEWTQCAFQGERLAASSGGFPFTVMLNGRPAPVQGVTAIGTEPQFRRRGLVRRLITDLLHRAHDEGQVASMLLASRGAIYQRFGYGLASTMARYEIDPREAIFNHDWQPSGRIERLGRDDALPHLKAVFLGFASNRNLYALRAGAVWETLLDNVAKDRAYCAVHFSEADEPDGYCLYETKFEGNGQTMTVFDFAWNTIAAWKMLWRFLMDHDLVEKVIFNHHHEDDPAAALLLEPRCLNRQTYDGLWLRITDLPGFLEARGYDMDGSLVMAVADTLCPWNSGSWRLDVAKGQASVAATDLTPDIECSPNSLASLVSGHASATFLHRIGALAAHDPGRLPAVDALFATRHRGALSFDF